MDFVNPKPAQGAQGNQPAQPAQPTHPVQYHPAAMAQAVPVSPADVADLSVEDGTLGSGSSTFSPLSDGEHVVRYVDCVDRGMVSYQGKKPTHQIVFVLLADEQEADGTPKMQVAWMSTSLFGGGPGMNTAKHLEMLRGITGRPTLTAADLRAYRTSMLPFPRDENGAVKPGRLARILTAGYVDGQGRQRARILAWKPAQEGDENVVPYTLQQAYLRPAWLNEMDVRNRPAPQAQGNAALAAQPARPQTQAAPQTAQQVIPPGAVRQALDASQQAPPATQTATPAAKPVQQAAQAGPTGNPEVDAILSGGSAGNGDGNSGGDGGALPF